MTSPALIERITRSLAYMLRHQPERFDLELDAHGYGSIDDVLRALIERLGETVTQEDLQTAVGSGDRPRYEIVGNRIRALYGHSIDVEPGESTRPPERLYVGISSRDADRALRNGLRGGRRRFLHLALTEEDARESGRRSGREYAVLTVSALDAWESGISFYDRKSLFLAEQIPTQYLELSGQYDDGFERPPLEGGRYDEPRRERGRQRDRGHGGPSDHRREREIHGEPEWHERDANTLEPVAANPGDFDAAAPPAPQTRHGGHHEDRPHPRHGGRDDRGDRGHGRHGRQGRDERRPAQGGGRPWREREGAQREGIQREGVQREGGQREGVQREGVQREGVQREGVQREGVQREGVQREGVQREGGRGGAREERGGERDRGGYRDRGEHRGGSRERFERRPERPERRDAPRPEPVPARPSPVSTAPEGPSFGSGIFEAPPAAPKPPPPREPVAPKEPPRRKEPEREASSGSNDSGGFGAGI